MNCYRLPTESVFSYHTVMEKERGEEGAKTPRIIDFHSHVLPAIDDGSRSLEMTRAMLEETYRQKIRKIVATPHFYPERMELGRFLEKRKTAAVSVLNSIYNKDVMPSVYLGAEVAYYSSIAESESIRELCIVGTNTLLVEMPFDRWANADIDNIMSLKNDLSLNVVIAHIERYAKYQKKETVPYLIERGIHIQSNGEYFISFGTKREALKLLEKGAIHILGSDMHNTTTRCQNLEEAKETIKKHLGVEYLVVLLENTKRLLEGAVTIDRLYKEG